MNLVLDFIGGIQLQLDFMLRTASIRDGLRVEGAIVAFAIRVGHLCG